MGFRVLVVEDEQGIAQILLEVLGQGGAEADWASDGLQARSYLERNQYGLILTDIIFTHTGGLDLIRWIRQRDPRIPIVAMTGFGAATAREAVEAGASEALLKPFDLKELRRVISRYIPQAST